MTKGSTAGVCQDAGTLISSPRRPRSGAGALFIMGPIPLAWIEAAGRTRGVGLHVAIEIWFRVGLRRSDEVKISLSGIARRFGFHRTSAARGLGDLEGVGLVLVRRRPGCTPLVRVVRDFQRRLGDVNSELGAEHAELRAEHAEVFGTLGSVRHTGEDVVSTG